MDEHNMKSWNQVFAELDWKYWLLIGSFVVLCTGFGAAKVFGSEEGGGLVPTEEVLTEELAAESKPSEGWFSDARAWFENKKQAYLDKKTAEEAAEKLAEPIPSTLIDPDNIALPEVEVDLTPPQKKTGDVLGGDVSTLLLPPVDDVEVAVVPLTREQEIANQLALLQAEQDALLGK